MKAPAMEVHVYGTCFDISHTVMPSGYYLLIVRQNTTNFMFMVPCILKISCK